MSTAAPTSVLPRRSTRSAARLLAAGAGGAAEPAVPAAAVAAGEEAGEQQHRRKRQRKAAPSAAEELAEQAAQAAADGAVPNPAAPKLAARGRGKTKSAAAAAGPSRQFEQDLWQQGFARVAGVDEAGRGPLAGPVVAAACIIPEHVTVGGIDDSKKLSAEQRDAIYDELTSHPDIVWAAKVIEADEIDTINILQAALKAMEGAAAGLEQQPDFLLVDGNRLPKGFDPERSRPIVKGDSKCFCIAAASVIAKVTRDRLMEQYHQQFPQYNFAGHKGYCVPEHVEAIRKHGPCAIHRRTFAPIKHWYPLEPPAGEEEAGAGGEAKKGGKKQGKAAGRKKTAAA